MSDIFPVFAPDGIHVAFVRWIQGLAGLPSKTEIWITDGRTERRVVQSPQFFTSITWSPDGTRLLFSLANLLFSQPLAVGFINADATGLQLFQAPVSSLSWSMAL